MAVVHFSSSQRAWVGGAERLEIDAARVSDLIRALIERFPELEGKIEEGAVAIDGDIFNDARYQPLEANSEVHFVGSVAGG